MAAALLRSQQARVWADVLAPAAETNAAGALWQNLRSLPATGTTCWLGKGSQRLPKQPTQTSTAADRQQRLTPLRQATEQSGQTAASQGGPEQKPVKRQVKQDTLWKELRNLLARPLHKFMARWAMSRIPATIEEKFDVSQFLEGCKDAFVAVHESMHSTRDLAGMVSLPVLQTCARDILAHEDKKLRCRIRPGSVNPGQASIVVWSLIPRNLWAHLNMITTRIGGSLLPMPGIAADDEHQDCPKKLDAKNDMVVGSSLVISVRFTGCSFVLETRDSVTGNLIGETLDQRCSTWMFGRGPLPNLTYPVHDFGADLPWVIVFT